jgi:hypothetical protein
MQQSRAVVKSKAPKPARTCGADARTGFATLSVMAKPETSRMEALYTITDGNTPICIDLPEDRALSFVRAHLRSLVGKE